MSRNRIYSRQQGSPVRHNLLNKKERTVRTMKIRKIPVAAAPIIIAIMVTACGGMSPSNHADIERYPVNKGVEAVESMGFDSAPVAIMPETAHTADESYTSENYGADVQDIGRENAEIAKNSMMIIRDAQITVDVASLDTFSSHLSSLVEKYGGYFSQSSINDYTNEWDTSRNADFTIRIPAKSLDDFLGLIGGEGSITYKNITAEDVSLEYVDIEAKITSLETEKNKLTELLRKAENVTDTIQIEERISNVQYELDSNERRRRLLADRVAYSTVNIEAVEERYVAHPIRKAFEINFQEKLVEGMENAVRTFVDIITAIPVIIIVTAFVLLFLFIVSRIWKVIFRSKNPGFRYMMVPVGIEEEDNKKEIKGKKKEPKKEELPPEKILENIMTADDDK